MAFRHVDTRSRSWTNSWQQVRKAASPSFLDRTHQRFDVEVASIAPKNANHAEFITDPNDDTKSICQEFITVPHLHMGAFTDHQSEWNEYMAETTWAPRIVADDPPRVGVAFVLAERPDQ